MSYIVISKELFKNPMYNHLSPEAKLLYGFLLDRSKLSKKNGEVWLDKNNEYYIYYTQAEVMERFRCSHDKASRLMKELELVGLLHRTPQGFGKPQRLVVKSVVQSANSTDHGNLNFSKSDSEKIAGNNTDSNHTDINQPEITLCRDRALIEKQFKRNISYDTLVTNTNRNILDNVVDVIMETLCQPVKTVRIAGEQKDMSEVYHRLMSLNDIHLHYIVDRIRREDQVIASPKGYVLRYSFYAPQEMDIYYESRLTRDEKYRRK